MFPVSTVLEKAGLYRPLKRIQRYLLDPQGRVNAAELDSDFRQTRREVKAWAAQKVPASRSMGQFGIISFTKLPLHAKFQCLLGKAMQLEGYDPVIFTSTGCRSGHRYFRLFGFDKLVLWDQFTPADGAESRQAEAETDRLLAEIRTAREALQITFRQVQVGKHALSVTCRKRVEGRPDFCDPDVRSLFASQLRLAIQGVLAAERFFDAHPVRKLLVRDAGYIPNGSIYEVALRRGIDCIVYEQGQRRGTWILKRYTPRNFGQHYFSLSDDTWQQVRSQPWTAELESKFKAEVNGRYQIDSTDDTRRLQSGKKFKSPEEVRQQLGLDPAKKTAVIFSHIAWDAAFFFGSCLFDDFEDWLFETVKHVAVKCPELNWVVKLHPFNVFKLQRESKGEESEMRLLRPLQPLPSHVKLMRADTDINTQSLFPVIDYVLTVNGTVGMEFPCFGVPAVVAGTGRYDGKGFTLEPRCRDEYFALLERLHTLGPLEPHIRALAQKHYLAVTVGRQFSLDQIAPMELKRLNEAQSDVHDNIAIRPRSLSEFKQAAAVAQLSSWLAAGAHSDLLSRWS